MKKLCFALVLASLALAQDAPKTMNKITVQLDGPEVPANSFARSPRTIYRAGSTYSCMIAFTSRRYLFHASAYSLTVQF